MEKLQKYNRIFEEIFGVENDELNEKFTMEEVGRWNSLAHISLISSIEDEFEIMFDPEDILAFDSYEQGKKILEKYNVEL